MKRYFLTVQSGHSPTKIEIVTGWGKIFQLWNRWWRGDRPDLVVSGSSQFCDAVSAMVPEVETGYLSVEIHDGKGVLQARVDVASEVLEALRP